MRPWPIAAAAATSLAMVGLAGVLLLPAASGPSADAPLTGEVFSSCVPPQLGVDALGDSAVLSCLERNLLEAIRVHGLAAADSAMKEAEQQNSLLPLVCHDTAHIVGKQVLELVVSADNAFTLTQAGSCDNGLMHGILDQIALQPVTDSELKTAAATCEQQLPDRLTDCADALGHVYWTSAPELPRAAERCEWFTSDIGKRACTSGVIMRMSARQEGTSTPVYTSQEILELCKDWPVKGRPYDDGCAAGLSFAVYSEATVTFQEEVHSVREGGLDGDVVGFLTELRPGQKLCEELPDKIAQARCITIIGDNAVRDTQLPELLPQWCEGVPKFSYPLCISQQPDAEIDARGRLVDENKPGEEPQRR